MVLVVNAQEAIEEIFWCLDMQIMYIVYTNIEDTSMQFPT